MTAAKRILELDEFATKGPWRTAEGLDGMFVAHGSNPITPPQYIACPTCASSAGSASNKETNNGR